MTNGLSWKVQMDYFRRETHVEIDKNQISGDAYYEINKLLQMLTVDESTNKKNPIFEIEKEKKIEEVNYLKQLHKDIKKGAFKMKEFDYENDYKLTQKETDILKLLMAGYRYEECAEILLISNYTLKSHVNNLFQKKHVTSLQELLCKEFRKIIEKYKPKDPNEENKVKIQNAMKFLRMKF